MSQVDEVITNYAVAEVGQLHLCQLINKEVLQTAMQYYTSCVQMPALGACHVPVHYTQAYLY